MHVDEIYANLVNDVLNNGTIKKNRTGIDTISVFGRQCRYELAKGFPILTSKRVHWKSVVGELLWFLQGNTNIKWLKENGISIWDEWADKDGNLGPVYGKQWRKWDHMFWRPYDPNSPVYDPTEIEIDQIKEVIEQIKTNPDSRRLIVSAWNVGDIPQMALAPCHTMFQFYVVNGKLSCQLYQRSCDAFFGMPFNIASYALLTHMIAQVCDLQVGDFVHTFGDLHLYSNAIEAAKRQITRTPFKMPTLWLNPEIKNIDDFKFEDIKLIDYQAHVNDFKVKVAV